MPTPKLPLKRCLDCSAIIPATKLRCAPCADLQRLRQERARIRLRSKNYKGYVIEKVSSSFIIRLEGKVLTTQKSLKQARAYINTLLQDQRSLSYAQTPSE